MADIFKTSIKGEDGSIFVSEDLDSEKAGMALTAAFTILFDKGIRKIDVDLSEVEIINSYGVGRLLSCYRKLEDNNGKLCVSGMKGFVKEVFRLLMLERLFAPEGEEENQNSPVQ